MTVLSKLDLHVNFIRASVGFNSLIEDWNKLLFANASFLHPFLTHEWLNTWYDHLEDNDSVYIAVVSDSLGVIYGLACVHIIDDTAYLGGDGSTTDYKGIVTSPGYANLVWRALITAIGELKVKQYSFDLIPEDSFLCRSLVEALDQEGVYFEQKEVVVAPRLELASSFDDYLMSLSRKDRHELRRKRRKAFAAGLRVEVYAGDLLESALQDFFKLMGKSSKDKEAFLTEPRKQFLTDVCARMYRSGLVRLAFGCIDYTPVASTLSFNFGDKLYLYNSGYEPEYAEASVGIALISEEIRSAITMGKKVFDFLRGNETYKYRLGAKDVHLVEFRFSM